MARLPVEDMQAIYESITSVLPERTEFHLVVRTPEDDDACAIIHSLYDEGPLLDAVIRLVARHRRGEVEIIDAP